MNQLQTQATELQKDFLKTITAERETCPANIAGHRSEIPKIAWELKNLEK